MIDADKLLRKIKNAFPDVNLFQAEGIVARVKEVYNGALELHAALMSEHAEAVEEKRRAELLQSRLKKVEAAFISYADVAEGTLSQQGPDALLALGEAKQRVLDLFNAVVPVEAFANHDQYAALGTQVKKDTDLPFKSMLRVNTVNGYCYHPITGRPAYLFEEDDSFVETRMCRPVECKVEQGLSSE